MELIFKTFKDPVTLLKIKIPKIISVLQWHFIYWHRYWKDTVFDIIINDADF